MKISKFGFLNRHQTWTISYQQNALPTKRENDETKRDFSSIFPKLIAATFAILAIAVIINASFFAISDCKFPKQFGK
jgi:hypothetical protein